MHGDSLCPVFAAVNLDKYLFGITWHYNKLHNYSPEKLKFVYIYSSNERIVWQIHGAWLETKFLME